ncbi:MAG TPA: hypothetical protein VFS21_07290 [Roseiflexaceae bacterium]|nr:hypothetical protein [Roseiflexaceae bacterium]
MTDHERMRWVNGRLARLRKRYFRGLLSWRELLTLYRSILSEFGEQV